MQWHPGDGRRAGNPGAGKNFKNVEDLLEGLRVPKGGADVAMVKKRSRQLTQCVVPAGTA